MSPARKQVVVSFSLNPQMVADTWEGRWPDGERIPPSIPKQLSAAHHAQDLGYEIRVRIDPILTPDGWQQAYEAFFAEIARKQISFQYYTLGTYREKNPQVGVWAQRWGMQPMDWQPEEVRADGTHRHLPEETRVGIYQQITAMIGGLLPKTRISLCKETHAVRNQMRLCNADCNCLV